MNVIKFLTVISILISVRAHAEVISCTGYTDSSQSTQVELTINATKKKGQIKFIAASGSVIQGLNLSNEVYYPAPDTLRYTDYGGNSFLDLQVVNGVIRQTAFTHGLYFKNAPLACVVNGQLPASPSCGANVNETLVAVLREGRFNQTTRAVNYQIACGADVNYTDKFGCTPLLYSMDANCGGNRNPGAHSITDLPQIADLLVTAGAFVDVVDPAKKETALLKAAKTGLRNVYDTFIAAEANFDFQDRDGMTPLMWAAYQGDDWNVKDILQARPDRRLKNRKGQTAFDIATQWQKERVIDLVRIPDVTIELKGQPDGSCSPLQIEAKEGQTVEFVLTATERMFKLESSVLELDVMADRNSKNTQIVKLSTAGTFGFTCGFHGSTKASSGQILVK